MDELLQNLIEALREELKQYGETLALLEQQQELAARCPGADPVQSVAAVTAQAEDIRVTRRECEQRRRHLAHILKLDEATGFEELVPHLPANYRPLVQALVRENNELLARVQQRARQSHLRLNRAGELMQRFINGLFPEAKGSRVTAPGCDRSVGRRTD